VKQIMYWATGAQPIASSGSPVVVAGRNASVTITVSGTTTVFYHAQDNTGNVETVRSTQVSLR